MIALVARHGETDWNRAGRYQGRRESTLTGLGTRQARALADSLATHEPRIARIVSSPLARCVATATASAERLGLSVEVDDRLIEIGHGDWEGRLRDEIARDDPEKWAAWRAVPATVTFSDGDSLARVAERWRAFAAGAFGVPTLIVTHDAVARVAVLLAQQRPLDQLWDVKMENAAYARFTTGAEWTLDAALVNGHLDGLRADTSAQAL